MSFLKSEPTLAELQEKDDYLTTKLSVTRKQALINELEGKAGKGSWKLFSDNGKKSGISFSKVLAWLKNH